MAKGKPTTRPKSDQTEVKQDPLTLGQHLSAVLNSPNLPAGLYSGIWDCLGDIPTGDLMDEPEFLDKLLKVGQEMKPEKTDSSEDSEGEDETATTKKQKQTALDD